MTERPHRSIRVATSPARRIGASNALPSRRPRNASATSVAVRTFGGGAGISSWRAPSRQIASTMPVSADRVSARASTSWSSARSEPGIVSISCESRAGSTSAGVQRTEYEPLVSRAVPPRRVRWRRNGTIAPRAVSSTAQIATRPSQRTLAPTPSTWPAPAATNQPSTSPTGIACASARPPPGSGTGPCRVQPAAGAPAAASISASSSDAADAAFFPAAHATTRPGSHDTCTSTTPGSRSRASGSSRSSRLGRPARAGRVGRLRAPLTGVTRPRVGEPAVLRLEVGDDLLALFAPQRARAREVLLGVAQQREERGAPRDRIGLEHRELFGRRVAVDLGIDVHVELPRRDRRRHRRLCHRSPLDTTEGATCVLEECGLENPSGPGRPKRPRLGNPAPPCRRERERNVDGALAGTAVANIVRHFSDVNRTAGSAVVLERTSFSRGSRPATPSESGPEP